MRQLKRIFQLMQSKGQYRPRWSFEVLDALMRMVEDNGAVIKLLLKRRAPTMGHVARVHRVNLDWLLDLGFLDPCIYCLYIETSKQLADILTKSHFTRETWISL